MTKLALLAGTGTALVLVLGACAGPKANAQPAVNDVVSAKLAAVLPPYSSQQVGISVSGSGSVKVTPDVVFLSFGVDVQDTTVAAARGQAADSMDAVMKSLKENGVLEKDIQTTSYRIDPVYSYDNRLQPNTPKLIGYRVSNSAAAKLRDLGKVGKIIDDAATAGGNDARVSSISFGIDDQKPLETQARDLAIKDAVAKAQQLAKGSGVKLGEAISISEQSYTPLMRESAPALAAGKAADFATTPISAGELQVSINVQVTFAIS